MKKSLGRTLLVAGLLILLTLFAWEALSDELHIIEVRRNIPLADTDPVYKDFYLNGGPEAGLKPNLVVTAVRKMSVKDSAGVQSFGELMIPVAQLKIIYSQDRLAVAREFKPLSRDLFPMLEQTGIMSGDLIDLKGSFVDNSKPSAKTTRKEATPPATPPAESTASVLKETADALERVSSQTE